MDERYFLAQREWWAAAPLAERAREYPICRTGDPDPDYLLTQYRLRKWRSQPPFEKTEWFAKRLEQIGLDELDLESLLVAASDSKRISIREPAWARQIRETYGISPAKIGLEATPGNRSLRREQGEFLALTDRLTNAAYTRVARKIRSHVANSSLCVDLESVEPWLRDALDRRLLPILSKVCALELNVASLEGRLAGASPTDRFNGFVRTLGESRSATRIFQMYPVIGRLLVQAARYWTAATLDWVRRLATDWDLVVQTFCCDGQDELVGAEATDGDLHCGGRAPVVLLFRSGFRVVYKPRPLALDRHFQDAVDWLNRVGQDPPLRALKIVDRHSYGWMEFAQHRPCASKTELTSFYRRHGSLLAVQYVFGGSDFHRENVIADGDQPILVDLETLFFPSIRRSEISIGAEASRRAHLDSVLRTGLLPHRIWGRNQSDGIDLSGLIGDGDQSTPFDVPSWAQAGTDTMHVVRNPTMLGPAANRPYLVEQSTVDVMNYTSEVAAGFERTYRLLMSCKESVLAPDGMLDYFRGDELRVVLRPTRTYSVLLNEGYHPDYLADATDRDCHFDLLWTSVPFARHLEPVLAFEHKSLCQGDIPRFTTLTDSLDLYASTDGRISEFFEASGLDNARERILRMSDSDLERQLWLIHASFSTFSGRVASRRPTEGGRFTSGASGSVPERALFLAERVGDRLCELAYEGATDATWVGLEAAGQDRWNLRPMRGDLYSGVPGVALFLGYLGYVQECPRFLKLARKAVRLILAEFAEFARRPIGAFNGCGGLIYSLCHLAPLLDAPELLNTAARLAREIGGFVADDMDHDVVGGSAGCIASLLVLYEMTGSESVLETAIACGRRLLSSSTRYPAGLGWVKPDIANQALAGFAHGAAGVSWALLRLAEVTSDEAFARAGWSGTCYERSLFSAAKGNWPDLRRSAHGVDTSGDSRLRFGVAWCHGAPGIGLSRLDLLSRFPQGIVEEEVRVACDTTLRAGFGGSHCLCHGDLGNLTLINRATGHESFGYLKRDCVYVVEGILDSIAERGPRCEVALDIDSPGLMTGLAGIGMGLLEIARPNSVPSVLLLEGPRTANS